jgi:antitoxin HicB
MATDKVKESRYRISLRFDPDGYWIAEHPELPGCVADGETAEDALASLTTARELWIESRLASGLDVPSPAEETQYSGRFVLRIPRSLHRDLAAEAEAEGVSLNSYISAILAGRSTRSSTRSSTDSLRVA